MTPLRVLIVSEMSVPYATGGGEVRYGLLAAALAARGHDVTWLSMRQRGSPTDETLDGVRHLHRGPHIAQPPHRPLAAKLRFMAAVAWHLLRHRYDVVDCQTYAPLPAAWLACRMSRQPMVAVIHDTSAPAAAGDQWLNRFDQRLAPWVEGALYRLPYPRIVTVSRAVADDLAGRLGVQPRRIRVLPCAVDLARIDGVAPAGDETDLVFVGRMVPHKHPEHFLDLLAALQRVSARPLRARMIGGGPLAPALRERIAREGLAVEWLGELASHDEVLARLKRSRLLVLPSTREGFGMVLAEAWACGAAVCAYDLPPVRETLGEAGAEALAPAGQWPALAAVAGRLLADEPARQAQARAGRARVESLFAVARMAQGAEAVYREILLPRPAR